MSKDQQLTNEQSLQIIQQMINQAKSNITETGLSWLLWGSMLFLTSMATYIFIDVDAKNIFLGWNIFGAVTIILLVADIVKPKRKPVRTYVDDLMKMVDIGFVVSMFCIILSINIAVSPNAGFGYMLMIFGFLMLVKSAAVKSRSLAIGAIVNWIGAVAIFFNKEFKYDMLIMAAAVLIGYIIPGFLLRSAYRKSIPAS